MYELECENCGMTEEVLITPISKFENKAIEIKKNIFDLKDLDVSCNKCDGTIFKKLISAHGKTAVNWASWQEGLSHKTGSRKSSRKRKK